MFYTFLLSCIGDETSSKNVQANRLFHLEIWGREHKVSFIVSRPNNSVFPSQEIFEAKQAGKRTKHKQTKTPASKATETEARRCEALNAARSLACCRRRCRCARQWNGAAAAARVGEPSRDKIHLCSFSPIQKPYFMMMTWYTQLPTLSVSQPHMNYYYMLRIKTYHTH